ncbi:MAG: hypothetical protein AB7V46_14480 [Thermomicrobiales bacterium]
MTRRYLLLIPAVVVLIALGSLVWWWQGLPPGAARLLPEADGYFYADLRPMRSAGLFDRLPEINFEPEYREFVEQTGINPERDLDEAAFAIHLPRANTGGPETRYSEVFAGRFDQQKLRAFLAKTAQNTTERRGSPVFEVPLPGRTVRAAILDNRVAASNLDQTSAIEHMLESNGKLLPQGPELLRSHYKHVPLGSPIWTILRAASSAGGSSGIMLPGGFRVGVPEGTVLVASIRYTGQIEFRAEAFTSGEAEAERLASHVGAYLSLMKALGAGVKVEGMESLGPLVESLQVERDEDRVVVRTSIDPKLLEGLFSKPSILDNKTP